MHVAGLADDNLRLTHGMRSPSACACRAVLSVHWCVNMLCVNIFTSNCPPTHLDWLMRVPTYMLLLSIYAAALWLLRALDGLGCRPARSTQHSTHTCSTHSLDHLQNLSPCIRESGQIHNLRPHAIMLRPLYHVIAWEPCRNAAACLDALRTMRI